MSKRKPKAAAPNTKCGGHAAKVFTRGIVADPAGNREERRAAKKLKVKGAQ
jgi:hypothetical protein